MIDKRVYLWRKSVTALYFYVYLYSYYKYLSCTGRLHAKIELVSDRQKACYMKNVIGKNIKRLRRQKEMKQASLAMELNIGRQTLSAYERGVTLPDVLALIKIADYFEISLDELTGRSDLIIPDEKE